ncbi:MAG: protein kinase [Methylococcaceae bacterium]
MNIGFVLHKRHDNIIHVIDHGITKDKAPFFVMPIYEGSIRNLIGSLTEDDCFKLVKKILDGVEASQKYDVVHRDLKPENILYRNSMSDVVLADFGIAEFGEEDLYTAVETKDGTRLANFQYAAPEQRVRGGKIGKETDIYSLGLIINEIFTGELALGKNHKNIGDYSKQYQYLDSIVERMLQQNISDRYSDISEVKKEMSALSREYIASLKISKLDSTVIESHEVDDPIVAEPMKITDVEWDRGVLHINLNHTINSTWQWAFLNMGNYSSVMGKSPEYFKFQGKIAIIGAGDESEAQRIINHFKEWLPKISQVYENKIRVEAKKSEHEEIEKLRRKIEEENKKKSINAGLSF